VIHSRTGDAVSQRIRVRAVIQRQTVRLSEPAGWGLYLHRWAVRWNGHWATCQLFSTSSLCGWLHERRKR